MSEGIIVVLSGPSGSGKSTVCHKVLKEFPMGFSVSCTTRQARAGEEAGVDYHFLGKVEFESKITQGDFLEHAEVHGNYYGTLRSEILGRIKRGKSVLLDIDVQGMRLIRESLKNDKELSKRTVFIFFAPPSYSELKARLTGRGTESEESLTKRLNNAKEELSAWREFDYLLVNDDVDKTVAEMLNIVRATQQKTSILADKLGEWPCGE